MSDITATKPEKKRRRRIGLNMSNRHKLEGLFFVSPFIIGTALFFIYPIFMSIRLSFSSINDIVGFDMDFIGIENYVAALFLDTEFLPIFLSVIGTTMSRVPLVVVFAILIAIMINRDIKARGFFRTVFFIPFLLGTGVVMDQILIQGVDQQVLSISDGLIPYNLLFYLGSDVADMITQFFSMLVQVLWSTGVPILLFLSGLQSISEALYESADIDGATEWEKFWKITIPMIAPTMLLVIVYSIVDSFTHARNPLLELIQGRAFVDILFERAAAMGWIYFAFILVMLLLVFVLLRAYIESGSAEYNHKKKVKR